MKGTRLLTSLLIAFPLWIGILPVFLTHAEEELSPRIWTFLLYKHVRNNGLVQKQAFDPIRLAFGVEPLCEDDPTNRECRDLSHLPSAVEISRDWWSARKESSDLAFLDNAPVEVAVLAEAYLALAAEIEQTATAMTPDSVDQRTASDIWRHSVLALGYERLALQTDLEFNRYFDEDFDPRSLSVGEYLIIEFKAISYTAVSHRLAHLCLKLDPQRQDRVCLALLAYDDSYETSIARYAERFEFLVENYREIGAWVQEEFEKDKYQFGILFPEMWPDYMHAVESLKSYWDRQQPNLKALLELSIDGDQSVEQAVSLERGFGPIWLYRHAANGNTVD